MADLQFERGSSDRPRGHALYYVRDQSNPDSVRASYIIVLPIVMDIAKYLPPMFAGGMAPGESASVQVLPWPPVPEEVASLSLLEALAEARGDDLLYGGEADFSRVDALLPRTAEAAQRYLDLYQAHPIAVESPSVAATESLPDLDVDDVLFSLMSERDRLSELVRRTGKLRDAVESNDRRELETSLAEVQRTAKRFPPKYRLDEFLTVATRPGAAGRRLTELYIDRCYRVLNEDYDGLRKIDEEIRALSA